MGILSRTPATLDALLRGLPNHWATAHEGGDTWSPYDIVGHLIHGETTDWIARARIIIEHGSSRAFERFDRQAQFRDRDAGTLDERLDRFAALRQQNLDVLRSFNLTDADLDRPGLHPDLGPVTLGQLLATWVAHDLDHLMQISRVLGRQYGDAVGPWRAYLRVISGQQG
jgi:hypothetical protein